MTYSGFVFGYPEVMAYVNDRIDENYTLLRPDALSFPVVAESTFTSVLAACNTKFTYELSATVPRGYTAACGGDLIDRHANAERETFTFRSKMPTWRIDLAVARFSVLSDSANKLRVYHLSGDSSGARRILDASLNTVHLYSRMFGSPKHYEGYTIIEIPDGWGSQAGDFYFLQTGAAFTDSSRIGEVYHELGHSWNATPSRDIQRCRYFDEAFASFFEPLAIRSFRGEQAFEECMEKARDAFVRRAAKDREVYDTPIADYGKTELGRHSYTKGAWSLYVLYTLVGEKAFDSIVHTMLVAFDGRTINFREFQSLCENVSKRSLDTFFREWIYGTESSRLMVERVAIAEIVKRY
jgi:aminopeptidase N